MVDRKAYASLVSDVSKLWVPIANPQMSWYEKCQQINLWTYWQGIGLEKVDILVVGQDWGKPFWEGTKGKKKLKQIDSNIANINAGRKDTLYLSPGITSPWATDRNLKDLISKIEGENGVLYPDIDKDRYDNLFFTNFCLGYRLQKESGGMTQNIMMNDSEYFRRLVACLNPKIIICLGKDTYECVIRSLFNINLNMSSGEYMEMLNDKNNITESSFNGSNLVVFGMGHCGAIG